MSGTSIGRTGPRSSTFPIRARPKIVSKLMTSHPWTHSHKVRVVGDLMVVNSEIEPGAGDRLAYPDGGFLIYDIKDPTNPKL